MPTPVRRYIRSLGLDAYVVGGAVRDELLGIEHTDEDFLVAGLDHEGLRAALEPHGRVEDMTVHGQLVGVRLHPSDRAVKRLVPKGIEITPPRAERSTGPGHRDFEIVADPAVTIEEDMGRRDFTVNAMARRLSTGELVDPFGGLADLGRRELRMVSPTSFAEDPLRLLRALRLVSQLGFGLTAETLEAMRVEAPGIRHVSAERIGGGVAADGLGELSKLLLGSRPGHALRLARDTGVLAHLLPELVPSLGHGVPSERQPLPLDEHLLTVVEHAAAAGASLTVRLAALLHDAGKPESEATGEPHAAVGGRLADGVLRRLRYPVRLRHDVTHVIRAHSFPLDLVGPARARRFLAEHGPALARDLLALKRADLQAKHVPDTERAQLTELTGLVEAEAGAPYRVADLAVDGADLIALGFREGPALGAALHALLDGVLDDPAANSRDRLLGRARELLP